MDVYKYVEDNITDAREKEQYIKDSFRKLANFIQSHDESNIIVFTHFVRKAESKFFKDEMFKH